jgi:hypothetical protein
MIVSVLTVLVLAFGPGAVLALAATPPDSRLRRVAVAASPSVTYGLIGGAVGWSTVFGRTWPPLGILAFEVVVVAGAVVARSLAARTGSAPRWTFHKHSVLRTRARTHRPDLVSLGASVAATLTVAWLMLGKLGSPPGWDSMNHAFMARRVLHLGSALPRDACVTGDVDPSSACAFYPLAPHVLWAQVCELTGQPLSTVMLATTMVVMPVTAAIGVFAIVRVCGGGSVLAGAAAFLPAIIGPMWPSLVTGRLTILLGSALAPSAALLFWMALRTPRARSLSAVAAVGLGGVALAHTYDVIAGAFLGVGLLIARPPRQRWQTWLVRTAGIALGTVLLLAPQAPGLLSARGERVVYPAHHPGDFFGSLYEWVAAPGQYLATLIAPAEPGAEQALTHVMGVGLTVSWILTLGWLVGLVACLHPRFAWGRPFAVAHVLTLAVVVTVDIGSGGLRDAVAGLFYGDPRRPLWSSLVAPGVLCLAGWLGALALAREGLRRIPRFPRLSGPAWVAPLVVAVGLTGAVAAVPDTWQAQHRFAERALPADPAYLRVGHWLRAHGGGVVADDLHREFVTWVGVDSGLPLLKGLVPLAGTTNPDWADRTRVWNALVWTKPRAGSCLPDRYDVRWVVVGREHMPGGRRTYRPDRLANSPYLHLAHVDGPLWVYSVDHLCG